MSKKEFDIQIEYSDTSPQETEVRFFKALNMLIKIKDLHVSSINNKVKEIKDTEKSVSFISVNDSVQRNLN